MPSAIAHVRTDRASRYLAQLAEHTRHMGAEDFYSPGRHDGVGTPPMVRSSEGSDTRGVIDFGWGRCTISATDTELVLAAEADDDEHLAQITAGIASRVHRIGRRDQLTVVWSPASPDGVQHAP